MEKLGIRKCNDNDGDNISKIGKMGNLILFITM
jgi:hypothetical protein